jgi:dipeptidyl aminopeptidase/acylaminoacyl peptidase
MRRIVFAALLTATSALAQTQPHPLTFNDLMAVRRVGAPQLSPDGKWIVFDASNIDLQDNMRKSAIYLVASSGGASRQITEGSKQDEGPAWSPDGKVIAFVSNRDGGAKQIYLWDVGTGGTRKISSLPGGAASVKWLPDGSGLVAVSDIYPDCGLDAACIKQKTDAAAAEPTSAHIATSLLYRHLIAWQEPTRSHIVLVPLNGSPRDLTPGPFDAPPFSLGGGDEFDVSPDSKELVFARNTDDHPELSTNSDLFLASLNGAPASAGGRSPAEAGAPRRITTRQGADTSPKYSPDGKWIAYPSQSRGGYESDLFELWLYNRATGTSSRVAESFPNWIEAMTWAPDSKSLYIVAPEKGENLLYRITLDNKVEPLNSVGSADAPVISRDGKTIYYDWSWLTSPTEIWSLPTRPSGNTQATAITHENDDLVRSWAIGMTASTFWTGADGAQVQGFIVKPPHFDATKRYPGIVLIHGGPQGAWSNDWSYRWNSQMFAARGYVVLMPNPRGSIGFGQKFVEEISGDWGGKVVTDIMNGVDMFAALPYVDRNRLGAAGGSFGGYMVDWLLGHTDRFKAFFTHDGVYNLTSMYGATEELWFPEFEFKGNPWDNPELYEKWSPSNYVKNFKTPTLIVHGELDYRVPINQGLELFTALQRRGVPSKLLVFPDEGHWVLKPQDSKLWYATVGSWFDEWLKKD